MDCLWTFAPSYFMCRHSWLDLSYYFAFIFVSDSLTALFNCQCTRLSIIGGSYYSTCFQACCTFYPPYSVFAYLIYYYVIVIQGFFVSPLLWLYDNSSTIYCQYLFWFFLIFFFMFFGLLIIRGLRGNRSILRGNRSILRKIPSFIPLFIGTTMIYKPAAGLYFAI